MPVRIVDRGNALIASEYRAALREAGLPPNTRVKDFVTHHRAQAKQEIILEQELALRRPLFERPAAHAVGAGAVFIDQEGKRYLSDGTNWTVMDK